MKKNTVSLLLAIVVLGCLLGVYFYLQNNESSNPPEAEPTAEAEQYFYLVERSKDELVSFSLTGPNGTFNFLQKLNEEDGSSSWYIEEYSDAAFAAYAISGLATSAYTLSTDTKLMDEKPENLGDYGLENPRVTLTSKFSDGSESNVYVGNIVPTGDYYYAMRDDDPALYLIYKYTGDRFFYGLEDFLDLSLTKISTETLTYAYIHEKDKPEILLDYMGTEEEKNNELTNYGAIVLTMFKPYEGREVYVTNLSEFILKGIDEIFVSELIEYEAEDFNQYGLDDPGLEILLKDAAGGELHIYVGDDTGNGTNYCRLADSNMVFTVTGDTFKNFYDVNVFSFTERFVALVNIVNVSDIEIRSEEASFDISLTHTKDEEDYDVIIPVVDGQEVQELAFKTYYQSLIGLSYDTEIPVFTPDGEPDITITYYLNDGQEPVVAKYYRYNSNFYAVKKGDFDIQFVVSKQSMDIMLNNKVKLLAGELDREY